MKKNLTFIIALVMIFASVSLPVSACESATPTSSCVVSNYDHGVYISSSQTCETFHPTASINNRKQMYLDLTLTTARYVFAEGQNSNLIYDNYLWAEYDSSIGTHEGVDMRRSNLRAIRTSLNGEVIFPAADESNPYGKVCIYNSSYNVTIIFMHMSRISVEAGETIPVGEFIGYQSDVGTTSSSHLHIQVENGRKTGAASGRENNLTSKIPYGYMSNEII